MKTFTFFRYGLLFTLISFSAIGSSQNLVNKIWQDTTGHPSLTATYQAAEKDSAGNIFIVGNTYVAGESENLLFVKYSPAGVLLWEDTFNSASNSSDIAINLYLKAGYVYVACAVWDSADAKSTILTVKVNASTGAWVWYKTYNGDYGGYDIPAAVIADNSGNVYVAGTDQLSLTDYQMVLVKYNSSGTQQWMANYDSAGFYDGAVAMEFSGSHITLTGFSGSGFGSWDFATPSFNTSTGVFLDVSRSSNGNGSFSSPAWISKDYNDNTYIAGTATQSGDNTDIKIIRYDTLFNDVWVDTWGNPDSMHDQAIAMTQDLYSNILVTGYTTNSNGSTSLVVLKYDKNDSLLWSRVVSAPHSTDSAVGMDVTSDYNLNVYVTGWQYNGIDKDFVTLAYDPDGTLLWGKTYDGSGADDIAFDVVVDNTGNNVYVSGMSIDSGNSRYVTMDYKPLTLTPSFAMDTDTMARYIYNRLIVRFDTGGLKYDAVNNKDLLYGDPETFLKGDFIDSLTLHLSGTDFDLSKSRLIKLAPNIHTWDTTLITRIGDTILVPPFWSSFLLVYNPGGDSSDEAYATVFETMKSQVKWAQLDYIFTAQCSTSTCTTLCPTDFYYDADNSSPYGEAESALHYDGGSYPEGNINAEGAWSYETGKSFVKVGVFDTPVNWQHEDFLKRGGGTLFDSKVGGWDYYLGHSLMLETAPFVQQHGTMMCGTIGALRNNNKGIAGLAGGNWCNSPPNNDPSEDEAGVSLYSFAISPGEVDGEALISSDNLVSAMADALFINPSLDFSDIDIGNYSIRLNAQDVSLPDVKEKFYYAFRLGKISVAARGNIDRYNELSYPACFNDDWVINVAGSYIDGDYDLRSMHGNNVDVVAPYDYTQNWTTNNDGSYIQKSGSSFSAAYVSGLAGLLLSYMNNASDRHDQSNLAPEDVEEIMQRTAYLPGTYVAPDERLGYGRIDCGAALNMVDKTDNRLFHFSDVGHSVSKTLTNLTPSGHIDLTLDEDVPNPIAAYLPAGAYKAEVWKGTYVVTHSITLATDESIDGFWARSSSSLCYPLYTTDAGVNHLEPYEKSYVEDDVTSPTVNATSATIWGYFYKMYDTNDNFLTWIPIDPNSPSTPFVVPIVSYTIHTHTAMPSTILDKQIKSVNFAVYPNPAKNSVYIDLKNDVTEDLSIKMYDASGNVVLDLFDGQASVVSEDFDVSQVSSGMYYIKAVSKSFAKEAKVVIIK